MGILDFLNSDPSQQAPQQQPQPAAAPAAMPQNYNDFVNRLLTATNANMDAGGLASRSIWNRLSGDDRKAAVANVLAKAPDMWNAFQQARAQSQGAQLNNASNLAASGAMANTNIDPDNINASIPALQASFSGAFNPSTQSGGDPLQQQRAMYDRMGMLYSRMPGMAQIAKDFFSLRDKGIPDGTTVMHDGTLVDAANGNAVKGSVGQVLANNAAPTKAMETGFANQHSAFQAGLDRTTNQMAADAKAGDTVESGVDKTTGLPTYQTDLNIARGAAPNFAASNPFFTGQQAELKDLRTKSESAGQGLDLAQQISNSANGLYTGKGAASLQDLRKSAQALAAATGVNVDPKWNDQTSKFEQLKFASQQLVAVASHNLSPRVAMNIYNQISAVKPGDTTSIQGLRDIINKQIVPALQRDKALYSGTSSYYQKNPFTNDAATVVPGQNPLEKFGVRDVHAAQPGDYYIDPTSGNLRQRPLQ